MAREAIFWFNSRTGGDITVDARAVDPESAEGSTAHFAAFDTSGWAVAGLSALSETLTFGSDANTPTMPASVGITNAADFDAVHPVEFVAQADTSPPTGATITCVPVSCNNPVGPVTLTYSATDAGSGIGHIWHTTDNTAPSATNGDDGDTVTMEQPGDVWFASVDNVGNATDPMHVAVEEADDASAEQHVPCRPDGRRPAARHGLLPRGRRTGDDHGDRVGQLRRGRVQLRPRRIPRRCRCGSAPTLGTRARAPRARRHGRRMGVRRRRPDADRR